MYKYVDVILDLEIELTKRFLNEFELDYDNQVNYTINCMEDNLVIGTISVFNNVIKCMAVSLNHQGENIGNKLVSLAINYIFNCGYEDVFVFTKPSNKLIFESMNFNLVVSTNLICFYEYNSSIKDVLNGLKTQYNLNKSYAAIVVNCNPMTNGHLYLIEQCSKNEENVIVFVVEEDLSYFKFSDRFAIVEKECARFDNVVVVPSTKYIISKQTFPTYFIKDEVDIDNESIELDLLIFKQYFMKVFNIYVRYVGSEPYSVLTNNYNEGMLKYLDNVVVVERSKLNNEYISATIVRELIAHNKIEQVMEYVPKTTYEVIKRYLDERS